MRREVMYRSISRITDDLNACEIPKFFSIYWESFSRGRNKEEKNNLTVPLTIFQKYMIATQNYTDNEKEICHIIGIERLLEVKYWEEISNIENIENIENIHKMLTNIRFAINQLPKILSLIKQDYVSEIKEQKSDLPEYLKGKSLLTVLIVENERQFSSPLRLTSALGAITDLYSVIATIENENENDLIVLACDSGSDKSFDFMGLAKLMEEVKEILITIWDRMVFYRQRYVSENISLIAKSLPVLESIEQLRENGSIGKEQAELLKRKTINGATQFIKAGATIPEFEAASSHNPKELMKPEPKLLVSSSSDVTHDESDSDEPRDAQTIQKSDVDSEELSSEEAEMLELLMKKAKTNKKS